MDEALNQLAFLFIGWLLGVLTNELLHMRSQ